MKTGVGLLISSAIFAIGISLIYGFLTHDPPGTILLGIMAFALTIAAGYIVVAEREARLIGDRADGTNEEVAGESVGTFTFRSTWPLVLSVAVVFLLIGALYNPPLMVASFLGLLAVVWMLVRESR